MRRLRIILRSKWIFKIILILCLLYSFIINFFVSYKSKYDINTNYFEVVVDKIDIGDNKISMVVKGREKLKLVYYFKRVEEVNEIEIGDKIIVNGILEEVSSNSVFNTFNYKSYLYNKRIYYIIKANKIKRIKANTSLVYDIRKQIDKRLERSKKSYKYLKTFILGDKGELNDYTDVYYNIGVSHLFSISGMHISLIVGILLYFLKRIFYNRLYSHVFIITLLIIYGIVIDFPASVLRTIVMFILFSINKIFNFKIKKCNLMFLVLSICIIIDPLIVNNIGFQFSYVISFGLILLYKKIYGIKNRLLRSMFVSYICFVLSLPICIYNYYQVNIISIFVNVIFIPYVSFIIFPLSLVCFVFPNFDSLLYFFISIMEHISLLIDKIDFCKLVFAKPSLVIVFCYYVLIIIMLKNKKFIFLFIIVIIIHKNIIYFKNYYNIVFFDVGQGDSSLIMFPHNKLNILVDTGGIYNSSFSNVENKLIVFLKSVGISRLNYLIISHGDYDHMGEAINLVNNFMVEKVILNCGELNDLEKDLIKVLNKKEIPYYSCIKELNIDNNKLYFLQTKEYDSENDNSSVIYTEINGYKFMFMGDASITTEKEILSKYNLPNIDVLKVGHHGSRTSSSEEFINEINPIYSIISVGKNNKYGHPNKEVLDNLKNLEIYRTDEDGSIMFKIKNSKLNIETCAP